MIHERVQIEGVDRTRLRYVVLLRVRVRWDELGVGNAMRSRMEGVLHGSINMCVRENGIYNVESIGWTKNCSVRLNRLVQTEPPAPP